MPRIGDRVVLSDLDLSFFFLHIVGKISQKTGIKNRLFFGPVF
jgi:hypothetical protein